MVLHVFLRPLWLTRRVKGTLPVVINLPSAQGAHLLPMARESLKLVRALLEEPIRGSRKITRNHLPRLLCLKGFATAMRRPKLRRKMKL